MESPTLESKRKPQHRTSLTQSKLLDAAILEFSERGYDATTIRDIEKRADVQRGLAHYHFGDKEKIWKEATSKLFREISQYRNLRSEVAEDLSVREKLSLRIRSFVRFSASNPELNRLMLQEGKYKSWRTSYIVENFLQENLKELRQLVSEISDIPDDVFFHWYYFFIGGGAHLFSTWPEASELFSIKSEATNEETIKRHGRMMVDLLMSQLDNYKRN